MYATTTILLQRTFVLLLDHINWELKMHTCMLQLLRLLLLLLLQLLLLSYEANALIVPTLVVLLFVLLYLFFRASFILTMRVAMCGP